MSKPVNCTIKNPARSEGGISGKLGHGRGAAIPGARLIQQIDIARSRIQPKNLHEPYKHSGGGRKDPLTVGNRNNCP